jgi:hypothetical protein
VRETRLVVESGNGVLDAGTGRGLDANCGNDGSLLVEHWNVKVARRNGPGADAGVYVKVRSKSDAGRQSHLRLG